jgi:hypothetical protein
MQARSIAILFAIYVSHRSAQYEAASFEESLEMIRTQKRLSDEQAKVLGKRLGVLIEMLKVLGVQEGSTKIARNSEASCYFVVLRF